VVREYSHNRGSLGTDTNCKLLQPEGQKGPGKLASGHRIGLSAGEGGGEETGGGNLNGGQSRTPVWRRDVQEGSCLNWKNRGGRGLQLPKWWGNLKTEFRRKETLKTRSRNKRGGEWKFLFSDR